jgi:NitT/TauT family transport system substrate-binding protein
MVDAFLKGVNDVIADPQEAFEVSKKYVDGLAGLPAEDQAIQNDILLATIEFWKSERPGYSNGQAWENMYNVLLQMELVPAGMDFNQAFTNEFIR